MIVPVKNAPTTAPKMVMYAEFAQSYIAHPKMVRSSFLGTAAIALASALVVSFPADRVVRR
jgi:hypothetical protein